MKLNKINLSIAKSLSTIFASVMIFVVLCIGYTAVSFAGDIVEPSTAKLTVNSVPKSFEAYSINQNTYFKLRDLAIMLKGDAKQFDVSWDSLKKEIILTRNQPYSVNSQEIAEIKGRTKIAQLNNAPILVDGKQVTLISYNIDQNNYFKLRDIMQLLDVSVDWNKTTQTIAIDTDKSYVAPKTLPLSDAIYSEAQVTPEDDNKLSTWEYQQKLSNGITDDVLAYSQNNPIVPSVKKNITPMGNRVDAYMSKNAGISQSEALWKVKVNMDKPEFTNSKLLTNEELNSITVLVNKRHRVPDNYVPSDLVQMTGRVSLRAAAKQSFDSMAAAAKLQGFTITPVSGFRTVQYQKGLYNRYLRSDSLANVETYSARAGFSEHHTGLAVDVAGSNNSMVNFGASKEYLWVKENAHRYGFIIRYLPESSNITGYKSEPWHLRYVGIEVAEKMKSQSIKTLEEYLGKNVL